LEKKQLLKKKWVHGIQKTYRPPEKIGSREQFCGWEKNHGPLSRGGKKTEGTGIVKKKEKGGKKKCLRKGKSIFPRKRKKKGELQTGKRSKKPYLRMQGGVYFAKKGCAEPKKKKKKNPKVG